LINGTSAARRPKVGVVGGGAPIPIIGDRGASKLSAAAARRDRRRALVISTYSNVNHLSEAVFKWPCSQLTQD